MGISYEIHPAIGFGRVGNSEEFFLATEPGTSPPAVFRDASGKLKRQAVRFRIFRCTRDDSGILLDFHEITSTDGAIDWTVTLSNRKGVAKRITREAGESVLRNNAQSGQEQKWIITSGPKTISRATPKVLFDDGKFDNFPVTLGLAELDEQDRLIVIPASGLASSPSNKSITEWADNDGWFDDVADGPVSASITLNETGEVVVPLGAWFVSAPPDFAPEITNVVTLYDALFDAAADRGLVTSGRLPGVPNPPAWDRDVSPILQRGMAHQWVNKNARRGHQPGRNGDMSVSNPVWEGIDDPASTTVVREDIFRLLRNPNLAALPVRSAKSMPRILPHEYPANTFLALSKRQYTILEEWSNGNFVRTAPALEEAFPDALTRAALEQCVGGAFFPGIEASKTILNPAWYMPGEPFRLSHSLAPGSVTEDMALPWQTDFYDCKWEGSAATGAAWWPAQRPDDVFTDISLSAMRDWAKGITSMDDMVTLWSRLGFVKRRQVGGSIVFVEDERTLP